MSPRTKRSTLLSVGGAVLLAVVLAWVLGRSAMQPTNPMADPGPPVPLEIDMGDAYQVVDKSCLSDVPWEGPVQSNPWMLLAWEPSGSYSVCTTTSRMTEEIDPAYDYYVATASLRSVTQARIPVDVPWDPRSVTPQVTLHLESSASARSNVYEASNPERPTMSCWEAAADAPRSAFVDGVLTLHDTDTGHFTTDTPALTIGGCGDYFVRSELTDTGATWQFDGPDMRDAIVVSYYQKVDQGQVPVFSAGLGS
ncbi:hypothetical protein [Demequina aurantiaca]|uniref:hypothetical protein n=1 Tax=Demequina aurantiaca TaxID=676200 RepID=UPI003D329FA9